MVRAILTGSEEEKARRVCVSRHDGGREDGSSDRGRSGEPGNLRRSPLVLRPVTYHGTGPVQEKTRQGRSWPGSLGHWVRPRSRNGQPVGVIVDVDVDADGGRR